jgi:PAS domain S-box-containing protein
LALKGQTENDGRGTSTARGSELERLVDLSVDMLCVCTLSGRFLVVNPACCLTLGYEERELVGRSGISLVHPDDRARTAAEAERLKVPGLEIVNFENRFLHRDGSHRWLVWSARSDGERIYAVARDVTESKHVEWRMREANSRFRSAFENAPIGMALFRLDRGSRYRALEVNRALCDIIGYSEHDLLNVLVPADTIYPEDFDVGRDEVLALLRGESDAATMEKRFVRGDGRVIWANVRLSLVRDDSGRPHHGICQFQDVTDSREAHDALRRTDQRLRTILRTTHEGIWMLDAEERTSFVNARMAKMLGHTVEEMQGRSVYDFLDEEGANLARKRLAGRHSGASGQHEVKYVGKDGREVWTIISATPLFDPDGTYLGVFAMVTDVTERTRQERAVRASEERYRNIIETSSEGVWMIDRDHRTTFANRRMAEMLGYTVEEMLGKPVSEFLPGDDRDGIRPGSSSSAGSTHPREVRYLRKDGSEMWGLLSGSPLSDGDGEYGGALAMIADITERKRSEDAVARLAAIVASSPDAIFSTDMEGTITSWNAAAERIYGYSEEEVLGQSAWLLSAPGHQEETIELSRRLRSGESVVDFLTSGVTKDGGTVDVAPSISPIYAADGEVIGTLAIIRPVGPQPGA